MRFSSHLLSVAFLSPLLLQNGEAQNRIIPGRTPLPSRQFPLTKTRSIVGTGNNRGGKAHDTMIRKGAASYEDKTGTAMSEDKRTNARLISNSIADQNLEKKNNDRNLSDMIWVFGQFLDHDLGLTASEAAAGTAPIPILGNNDPFGAGNEMDFTRAAYVDGTGSGRRPRQYANEITSFIDASMVYGSDDERARALRSFHNGLLKTLSTKSLRKQVGNKAPNLTVNTALPPLNERGLHNEGGDDDKGLFLVGDVRGNEQVGLLAIHTLFVREHNRLARKIKSVYPGESDERIYQLARKIVGAEIQHITYNEFLPAILGPMAPKLSSYQGHNKRTNAGLTVEFTGAAFRLGHSMLSSDLNMVNNRGKVVETITLREAFFNVELVMKDPTKVDLLLNGFMRQKANEIDPFMIDDIRNFLFENIGANGLDLASLNIQRSRDMGLPKYNAARRAFGLPAKSNFAQVTSNRALARKLQQIYGKPTNMDLWVGCLAEDHVRGASVGRLLGTILKEQFNRLMHADKFFYLNDPDMRNPQLKKVIDIRKVGLSNVVAMNTHIKPKNLNAFKV